ncbi:uncharacterized protein LOC143450523 [Clavelina lepadiformis]|uniref:uncharacterized protein LOC143450523 n=1 Tax=Clavelina lepadiformis TaxID=159417 RepID=UPI0040432F09
MKDMDCLKVFTITCLILLSCVIVGKGILLLDRRCPKPSQQLGCQPCIPQSGGCGCGKICCLEECGASCVTIPNPPELDCLLYIKCGQPLDCNPARDCPAVPGARCTRNCHCKTSYLDCNGKLLTKNECKPTECPEPSKGFFGFKHYTCTNGNQFGSFCTATCPHGTSLNGNKKIKCQTNGKWYPGDFTDNSCSKKSTCPNGEVIANCIKDPCMGQTCPAVPSAVCQSNYCGTCSYDFYINGMKVPRWLCFLTSPEIS